MTDSGTPLESLAEWLHKKPYWERYVWMLCFEKVAPTADDLKQCYAYLSEYLELIDKIAEKPPIPSFESKPISIQPESATPGRIRLVQIKDFKEVNALREDCVINLGSQLTLIYGSNGSGKSGVGRLLCKACFSRGKRELLPNVRVMPDATPCATATFVLESEQNVRTEVKYSLGDSNADLMRFSVFDSDSVLIHLDQSNQVSFTPSFIQVFDRVSDVILKLEETLAIERGAKRKEDPFGSMFLDGTTSATATFCKNLSGTTNIEEFLKHANFDPKIDSARLASLQQLIDEKKRLDIPERKKQLVDDRLDLEALHKTLRGTIDQFSTERAEAINTILANLRHQRAFVQRLGAESFDNQLFASTGSESWKALLITAKELYEYERSAGDDNSDKCVLCHQELSPDAKTLFQRYWAFLESKAEVELSELTQQHAKMVEELRSVKSSFPKFLDTDAGIRILRNEAPEYLLQLRRTLDAIGKLAEDWIIKASELNKVNTDFGEPVDLGTLNTLISQKLTEEQNLVDPARDIAELSVELDALTHRKQVAAVKAAGLAYIDFLHWSGKAANVGFSGIKMAITKKRTEQFLLGVLQDYKGAFNSELDKLACDFNLVMSASGQQGNTLKEYRLDFAEDYNPSQILSEGEQNACALADFLTEVQLDKSNCGIILDDPVTSLDHERKDKIAKRLVEESVSRQVVVFTHDVVFMSQLVRHADRSKVHTVRHWMRRVDGTPGFVDEDTSPRLSSVASLKADSQDAIKDFAALDAKAQERALGIAFDYLRSACEALIEEVLFAGTVKRYEDHIRVMNLEEVVFDQALALKIVELHGTISGVILAHDCSDEFRENPPTIEDLKGLRASFDEIDANLKAARKLAIKGRDDRKNESTTKKVGW